MSLEDFIRAASDNQRGQVNSSRALRIGVLKVKWMPSDACREEVRATLDCKTRGLRFGSCHRQMPNPMALARAPLESRSFWKNDVWAGRLHDITIRTGLDLRWR